MAEATDPINPPNPFFYSFGQFLAKIRKIQKPIKIILIFLIFPFKGWPISLFSWGAPSQELCPPRPGDNFPEPGLPATGSGHTSYLGQKKFFPKGSDPTFK